MNFIHTVITAIYFTLYFAIGLFTSLGIQLMEYKSKIDKIMFRALFFCVVLSVSLSYFPLMGVIK